MFFWVFCVSSSSDFPPASARENHLPFFGVDRIFKCFYDYLCIITYFPCGTSGEGFEGIRDLRLKNRTPGIGGVSC